MIGIDPLYFWDEMSNDELAAIYKAKNEANRVSWEQARLICFYNVVASQGTKNFKKPEDLFLLTWDKKSKKNAARGSKPMTKEEFTARAMAIRGIRNKNRQ